VWSLAGGAFLGWALGANDAANVFGTAVAARVVRFGTAAVICSVFLIAGATLEGAEGIKTLGGISQASMAAAVVASASAALVVTVMTRLGIPVSTSQAVVGAIIGIGLTVGDPRWEGLPKILICWMATPIGALVMACALHALGGILINRVPMSMLTRDNLLWGMLVVVGAYGAYALGANNVANVTGMYYHAGLVEDAALLGLLGGVFMSIGVLTYSRRVMITVGAKLVRLDAYAALVVITAQAVTVHVFAWVGVPVSTSQAVIGGVIGVGLMRGTRAIHVDVLKGICLGWVLSPLIAAFAATAIYRLAT
jgi:PiT family inorganic phosphate transporter